MFNPLVHDFKELSDSEIDLKISELSRKYFMARNPQLQSQISTILEMYKQEAYTRREQQKLRQMEQNGDNDLDNLIKIS